MQSLDLALIGNCSFAALLDRHANVVWSCMPRFDSDPVFDRLLREGGPLDGPGVFAVELFDLVRSEQHYVDDTAVVKTRLFDAHGGVVEVTDFAPRFRQFGRMFRPVTLVRHVRPLAGTPRIRLLVRPVDESGAGRVEISHGSNHIRYQLPDQVLRLTTDASITRVLDEIPFVLEHDVTLVLGPDESLPESVAEVGRRFYQQTVAYWHDWVRALAIPLEWQDAVIRAAITLKLNAYDDTGAIVAALTTSIPEAPHSGRNWDYRYCWLRDAYFVVSALNRLNTTITLERYISYIVNVAADHAGRPLQPVYRINGRAALEERVVEHLPGYRGMGPVRVGNAAYQQVQNDSYGAVVLAATHAFFDRRMAWRGNESLFERLEPLGEQAYAVYRQPDAGLWEYRTSSRVHTFSAVMCWAACDRLARIARRLGLEARAKHWAARAAEMHAVIATEAWNERLGSFVDAFGGEHLDASLLLLNELGFLRADDPRFAATVAAVERELKRGPWVFRYVREDDFGAPETAFLVCTFWYIDALIALGRRDEARELFEHVLEHRNRHGLLSEDIHPDTGELWGNFPQTYSMVGLVTCAMRLSRSWEETV